MSSTDLMKAYETLAGKYSIPHRVVRDLGDLIEKANGNKVHFDIPELGGKGIWAQTQGATIGNGFNDALNNRATELCEDIGRLLSETKRPDETTILNSLNETTGLMPISIAPRTKTWWPERYGSTPTIMGNAGGFRFAYFVDVNRLVIQNNLRNRIFDTDGTNIVDVVGGKRAGFFNIVIKTVDDEMSITQFREVAR